jgi:hypothetical protein
MVLHPVTNTPSMINVRDQPKASDGVGSRFRMVCVEVETAFRVWKRLCNEPGTFVLFCSSGTDEPWPWPLTLTLSSDPRYWPCSLAKIDRLSVLSTGSSRDRGILDISPQRRRTLKTSWTSDIQGAKAGRWGGELSLPKRTAPVTPLDQK